MFYNIHINNFLVLLSNLLNGDYHDQKMVVTSINDFYFAF